MTTLSPMMSRPDDRGPESPRAPWPVVVAFYLWWSIVAAQAIGLAYVGFTLALAAQIGGPAWDILFIVGPFTLAAIILTPLEIGLVVRLRQRSRIARTWLLILAVPAALSILLILSPAVQWALTAASSVSFASVGRGASLSGVVVAIVIVIFLVAIAAGGLPFIGSAGNYFRKPPHDLSQQINAPGAG